MKLNDIFNLSREIEKVRNRIPAQEFTLGRSLKQPFCNANSGSRKIMQGIQMEQTVQILNPEVPIVSTGYENQLGYMSSNFIVADRDYKIVARINKFSQHPNHHYWYILYSEKDNYLTYIERVSYLHVTEFFGYLFDNEYLDSRLINDVISTGDVIKKTISYDEYNNRAEGLNLTTMYVACEDVKEDPIVISESAAKRFSCPLIDKIEIKINDNDILLNLYGDNEKHEYKTFPNIGESVKNNIFCAIRRELKDEEALFTQSWDRLQQIMMNDKKFLCDDGIIVDINVFCNNPEKLENSIYNNQLKIYYDESVRFSREFVEKVGPWINKPGINVSYEMSKLYNTLSLVNNGVQYIQDKVFSNVMMEIYIQHSKPLHRGDKITDRYGGKGVISKVRPDNMMPKYLKDGKWKPVDVLYSMCTCINRLNDGQLFETSVTYIGWQLLEYIKQNIKDYNQAFKLILKYIELLNPEQAEDLLHLHRTEGIDLECPDPMEDSIDYIGDDARYERNVFIEQMLHDGFIMVSIPPISSGMDIDKIKKIYDTFPFIKKYCPVVVPQKDSRGNYRDIYTRRPLVIGSKYIFRLKQLAEEKFSAVSLASTNIRNENSKSRLAKTHNARFASTPVKVYGEMESSAISAHIGIDNFIEVFLLYSSSPEARRQNKELLIGDPFSFNIELDENCIAQSADMVQAYLKILGERLSFHKVRKYIYKPAMISVVESVGNKFSNVVYEIPKEIRDKYKTNVDARGDHIISKEERAEITEYARKLYEEEVKQNEKEFIEVARIIPGIKEQNEEFEEYKEKLRKIGIDPRYVIK